jgi:hypothetical protein
MNEDYFTDVNGNEYRLKFLFDGAITREYKAFRGHAKAIAEGEIYEDGEEMNADEKLSICYCDFVSECGNCKKKRNMRKKKQRYVSHGSNAGAKMVYSEPIVSEPIVPVVVPIPVEFPICEAFMNIDLA